MKNITSKDNKILKHTKKLASSSYRRKLSEFIAEGERLCTEALSCNKAQLSYAIATEEFLAANSDFQKKLDDSRISVYTVSEKLFESVSQTDTPQGVLLAIKIPSEQTADFTDVTRILILDGISEPGNMGTIIRTADAFGFSTTILCNNCVDIYNPKVVRATMGGIFRTKFININNISDVMSTIKIAKTEGFQVLATSLENSVDITSVKFGIKCAIIIGNEANGISDELLALSDMKIKIPMSDGAESLNAAIAAGIAMFKAMEDTIK